MLHDQFLRATAGTAIARLSHRNSVCPSVTNPTSGVWAQVNAQQRRLVLQRCAQTPLVGFVVDLLDNKLYNILACQDVVQLVIVVQLFVDLL